jgi:hypothetical protein
MKKAAKIKRIAMRSPRGICEIGPPRKHKATLVLREVAPGKRVAHIGPDPEAGLRDGIMQMRLAAHRAIIAEGGNPEQTAQIILKKEQMPDGADRAYFAAILYEQLARTENCLRVLLTCPPEDVRWHGLRLANEMDHSRFFWQRLQLVEREKFTVAGEGTSRGGKKSKQWNLQAELNKKRVHEIFAGKVFARGEMKDAIADAMAKTRLSRSQIYALKKMVQ